MRSGVRLAIYGAAAPPAFGKKLPSNSSFSDTSFNMLASIPSLPGSPDQIRLPQLQRAAMANRYAAVRAHSMALAAPLSAQDQCVQTMQDASPTKWHLAHASWFFETVVLQPHVMRYRAHVDAAMQDFIEQADAAVWQTALQFITLGLHHEQQHQELLLTDILHAFSCNPLLPSYHEAPLQHKPPALRLATAGPALQWLKMPERLASIGSDVLGAPGVEPVSQAGFDEAFVFDNESPKHQRLLHAHEIASQLVTCGEYSEFVADGGYRQAGLWLSDGWAAVQANHWQAPLHWLAPGDSRSPSPHWQVFSLNGVCPMDPAAPVSHLSFYEAAAYAEWAGARLPTEFEWEAAFDAPGISQMTGHVWQWTRSSYDPYPGFKPMPGAVSEYNGKFMVSQIVLRGGSTATAQGHTRASYRNFFPPGARWQFSGLRLARDL